MMPKETYSVQVECSNCEQSGTREITKGVPVPPLMECPRCGCVTAKKKQKNIHIQVTKPYNPWVDFPKYEPPPPRWIDDSPRVGDIYCEESPTPPFHGWPETR